MKQKYDIRDEKGRHVRPLFFKYIDGYKGYRDGYYLYKETEDGDFSKLGCVDSRSDAMQYRANSDSSVLIEKGRMSYRKHETAMDYLETAINRFRVPQIRNAQPKPFSSCLVPLSGLCGQVKSSQAKRIIDAVRETKKKISGVWCSNDGLSHYQKKQMALEIHQECVQYVSSFVIGVRTMRYLLTLIDRQDHADISKLLFTILFSTARGTFYELIELSRDPIYRLEEQPDGDINIFNFAYKKVEENAKYPGFGRL